MSRPVIHEKRRHGMIHQTLATCGLWLSTACGDATAPEQELMEEAAAPTAVRAQAVEGDSCNPDTTPPVVTCDAEAIEECGGYLIEPKNFEFSDNCGLEYVSFAYPTYKMPGDISISGFARDLAHNTTSCTTVFHVFDTQPPDVELSGPSELTLTVGSVYIEQGGYAHDECMHGGFGGQGVNPVGTVNTNVPGTYVLTYSLTDPWGNTGTATRTVRVVASTPTSTQAANTTQSRLRHTATLLDNGRVLVLGGYSRTAEEYNPSTQTWAAVGAPLATHRGHTASLLDDGTVLVAGGTKVGAASVEELYDPAQGQWSRTGRMSTPRYDHTAVVLPDGKVLVAGGGASESSGGALASAELYDPTTRQWSATGSLLAARRNHTMTLLPGLGVLVTGGVGTDGALLSSAELYTSSTGTWTSVGDLATARSAHTATRMNDGKVLVVGGLTQDSSLGATSELFDPATSSWSPAGSMDSPRQSHTATLVKGQVLVTGGYNPRTGIQYSSEIYSPGAGWRGYQASLHQDRYKHTATSLDADTVLLVGGYSNADPSATTTELYSLP
ncbi:DUF5011 domain-containing protein [Cystobacter fuscus]|uniref:kelch repeat-containing protein n=1 Tax=Cystobacter fuscus TaxID=43 RepID=UPI002B2B11FC|nr:DUF5011 domain-containing protein [Cystobacter fuscus]